MSSHRLYYMLISIQWATCNGLIRLSRVFKAQTEGSGFLPKAQTGGTGFSPKYRFEKKYVVLLIVFNSAHWLKIHF